ncbi:hypothetical protein CBR_g26250 [Chara braunii]|uniref:HYDIN/VesB/CFA65-like Ig-like domain-containing protein n=1 Tax=Chara braunii TaxID=69332 RepID=A0A388L7F0_CHABU|nr:hypothetical protein CBR_g26250 [Chara braunii]|eukprot:GBG78217.1 hypothetical protein CBR_g26250 [Chara braunii]
MVYCDISGRAERLPLLLKGQGVGPQVLFTYDVLDVGKLFISSLHVYEVDLLNRGEIEARFQLVPNRSRFGRQFTIDPTEGVIHAGESQTIYISFTPSTIGEFSEHFMWKVEGSLEDLVVHLKGTVIGPTFHLDMDTIDFGKVSYSFQYSKDVQVHNDSDIPMRFVLRLDVDEGVKGEFSIVPTEATILPWMK